ncbi:MAG: hypothetical protein VKK42_03430, partial [Lyngbya sp.]|nr:hypothetical protein [Lyngbya sp.]
NYTAQSPVSIDDTVDGTEILAAGTSHRYVIIRITGEETFISLGANPTTTNYAIKLIQGVDLVDWLVNTQQLKAICAASKTSTVNIWTAPIVSINV